MNDRSRKLRPARPVDGVAPRILSLSGGGVRGLFSATVLARLKELAGRDVTSDVALLAGTSIGGIIALGLASNKSPETIAYAIEKHAPLIFKKRRMEKFLNPYQMFRARYAKEPLETAIRSILGPIADRKMSSIDRPVFVTVVDTEAQRTTIFKSGPLLSKGDPDIKIIDAALATSAAPTYFPSHLIGGRAYVDGGLAANAPDLVALHLYPQLGTIAAEPRLLSIGTAGLPTSGPADPGRAGAARWVVGHKLVEMTFRVQEGLTTRLAQAAIGERYHRVDGLPDRVIDLDNSSENSLQLLKRLGADAANELYQNRTKRQNFVE